MNGLFKKVLYAFAIILLAVVLINIFDEKFAGGFFETSFVQLLPSLITVIVSFVLVQKLTEERSSRAAFKEAVATLSELHNNLEQSSIELCQAWKATPDLNKLNSERRSITIKLRTFENYLSELSQSFVAKPYKQDFDNVLECYKKCNDACGNIGATSTDHSTDEIEKEIAALKDRVLRLHIKVLLPRESSKYNAKAKR